MSDRIFLNRIITSCNQCRYFGISKSEKSGVCMHRDGPSAISIPLGDLPVYDPYLYSIDIPDGCPLDIYQEAEQVQAVNDKIDTTQIPKYSNFEEWAKANGADLDGGVIVSATSSLIDCPDATINKETIDRYRRLFGISVITHNGNQLNNPEIEVNELGGKQSKLKERFDFLPPNAVSSCARTIGYGESKYGEGNWKKISILSHINHALGHLFKYLAKDKSEDHLSHAASRLLFALELEIRKKGSDDGGNHN